MLWGGMVEIGNIIIKIKRRGGLRRKHINKIKKRVLP